MNNENFGMEWLYGKHAYRVVEITRNMHPHSRMIKVNGQQATQDDIG